ncbi:hypothetical protein GCM10007937_41800 [Mesorhizobium albiziae]|nr:hypothetical protein GCM10007937_41800 [Mesorhizobium albiziae]
MRIVGIEYLAAIDMMTFVATRGRGFPIAWLGSRLKCQRCGSDRVRILLDFPAQPTLNAQAASDDYRTGTME